MARMNKRYYYDCPRGFANEFSILSVDPMSDKELTLEDQRLRAYERTRNENWDFHRITAKRAHEIIRSERATKRSYLSAGMNLTQNPVGATEITPISEMYED